MSQISKPKIFSLWPFVVQFTDRCAGLQLGEHDKDFLPSPLTPWGFGVFSMKFLRTSKGKELYSSIILFLGPLCGPNSILPYANPTPCCIHRLKDTFQFPLMTGINSQAHSVISFTSDLLINNHLSDNNHILVTRERICLYSSMKETRIFILFQFWFSWIIFLLFKI